MCRCSNPRSRPSRQSPSRCGGTSGGTRSSVGRRYSCQPRLRCLRQSHFRRRRQNRCVCGMLVSCPMIGLTLRRLLASLQGVILLPSGRDSRNRRTRILCQPTTIRSLCPRLPFTRLPFTRLCAILQFVGSVRRWRSLCRPTLRLSFLSLLRFPFVRPIVRFLPIVRCRPTSAHGFHPRGPATRPAPSP